LTKKSKEEFLNKWALTLMVWSARSGSEPEKNGETGREKEEEEETLMTEEEETPMTEEEETLMTEEVEETQTPTAEEEEETQTLTVEEEEETQTPTVEEVTENGKMRSGEMKNGQMKWTVSGTLMELLLNGATTTSKEIFLLLLCVPGTKSWLLREDACLAHL